MANSFNDAFLAALDRLGLKSQVYKAKVLNDVLKVDGVSGVDVIKFTIWFNDWIATLNFSTITAIGRYFVSAFLTQVKLGTFDINQTLNSNSTIDVSTPQSAEEFEQSWEDWKKLLNELDPDDGIPSKGVLCQDDNTNAARAIFDGDGGIVYIDGTLSERYPRFEDLNDEKKRELSNACIKLHRGAGCLERFKGLMEKIKPYETAS